jgi:hypothetical protein
MKARKFLCGTALFICWLPCAVALAGKAAPEPSPLSQDLSKYLGKRWYGIYFMDKKIGYAEANVERKIYEGKQAVTVSLKLRAEVAMLGKPQGMSISEVRTYVLNEGLVYFLSETRSGGGIMRLRGVATDGTMRISSVVGGQEKTSVTARPEEKFEDYIAEERLVADGAKVGDELSFTQYQPTMEKSVTAVSRIKGIETKWMKGVPTRLYSVETVIKDLGVTSTSLLSAGGDVLKTQVAGVFTMRLEDERLAKNIDYRSDVILSTVIRPAKKIEKPQAVRTLKVMVSGIGDRPQLIESERQSYQLLPDGKALLTVKVQDLSGVEIPEIPLPVRDFSSELAPSLFIQSDAPEVVACAKSIVGEERNARKVSDRLVQWVFKNLEKRFSASFSNALDVLALRSGDCTEHSVLYVALARAVGLPARDVSGVMYTADDHGFYYHQWAEVYVGKWIAVDPTFDQEQADATHIQLVSGDLASQARLISLIGTLGIEVLEVHYNEKK